MNNQEFAQQITLLVDQVESVVMERIRQLETRVTAITEKEREQSSGIASEFSETDATTSKDVTISQNDLQQLQADSELLLQAWEQVEEEQRQLLAARSIGTATSQSARVMSAGNQLAAQVPKTLHDHRGSREVIVARSNSSAAMDEFTQNQLRAAVRGFGRK